MYLRGGVTQRPPLDRPKTRGDCKDGPRPCPWVGCRHHLLIDVRRGVLYAYGHEARGDAQRVFDSWVDQMDKDNPVPSCSLDVADEGEHTVDQLATLLGVHSRGIVTELSVAQEAMRARLS